MGLKIKMLLDITNDMTLTIDANKVGITVESIANAEVKCSLFKVKQEINVVASVIKTKINDLFKDGI